MQFAVLLYWNILQAISNILALLHEVDKASTQPEQSVKVFIITNLLYFKTRPYF